MLPKLGYGLPLAMMLVGCTPAIEYTLPDSVPIKKPLRPLGPFSFDVGGCGRYSAQSVDREIIRPAIVGKLRELNAATAENIVVKERWYDIPLGLLIIPALFGCSNWTITGDALGIEG